MLKEHNSIITKIHKTWDICLTVISFLGAYFIKKYFLPEEFRGLALQPNYYAILLTCILIWFFVFEYSGLYRSFRRWWFKNIAWEVIKAVSVCILILLAFIFLFKQVALSRIFICLFFCLNLVALIVSKWFIYSTLARIRKKGYNLRNILLVGCHARANDIVRAVQGHPETGYRIIGCLATQKADINENRNECLSSNIPVLGTINDLKKVMKDNVVDEMFISESLRNISNADRFIYKAESMGISVHILPEWGIHEMGFKPKIGKFQFKSGFGVPTLSLITTPDRNPTIIVKNFFDFVFSALGLIICAIPFLLIAICIKISSDGPVFFKQERLGLNGRIFMLYKFRTMVLNAESLKTDLIKLNESDGPVFKIKKDPRVIPYIGTLLRKTSLDELPQLINVFKGEMSLIGPRPPLQDEVDVYDRYQRRRLSMKPGLSCLWQISPSRNDLSFDQWVHLDLKYIDNWSLKLDMTILLRTVWVVLMGYGR